MKKVLVSFALVILTSTLSVILTDWTYANFDVAISTSILAWSVISIALAVVLYANIFDREVTFRPSVHFHPVTDLEDMKLDPSVEQGIKDFAEAVANPKYPTDAPSPVTRKGMIKKGEKLSPEHRAKISASLKKRNAAKKTAQKKSGK